MRDHGRNFPPLSLPERTVTADTDLRLARYFGLSEGVFLGLPATHPGQFLAETLDALGLSQAAFARTIRVSPMRISHVAKGARPVTAELALLFGRALGQSPDYWLNLQSAYDLKVAEAALGRRRASIARVARR